MKKKQTGNTSKLFRYSSLLVILIPLVLYVSALRLGFVYFDDDTLILDNSEKLSQFSNLDLAFRSDAFFANLSPYYRPLMNVSFMIDAAIGGTSPVMYHMSNVIYHLLASLSLLTLLSLLGFSKPKSLTGTLVFALHPMMGHAVLWIPARGDLLVTLFGLLAFTFFIHFIRGKGFRYLLLHVFCLAGAVFSKESAVILPLFFLLWLLVREEKPANSQKMILAGSWLLILASWYYLRYISIDQRSDPQQGLTSMIQNIAFLPEAVSRFFFPFMLPVTPVFSAVYTIGGIVVIILVTVYIFRTASAGTIKLTLFGAAWFIGFCLPNMLVRLVSANDNFEYLLHRTYFPYIGLLILLLSASPEKWFELKSRPYNIIVLFLLILFSCFSVAQQRNYNNAESFWNSAIRYAPGKAWFPYYLGRYYFRQKDFPRAEHYFLRSDSLKSYPVFKYFLGKVAWIENKDYEKAYSYFTQAFRQGYGGDEARSNFIALCIESGNDYFQKGLYTKAIKRCEEALVNDPSNGVAAYNLGIYLVNTGEKQQAAAMWKRAILLKPDLTEAYRSLCFYYQYDVKKADSAAWYAREFNNHGGTGNLISPL